MNVELLSFFKSQALSFTLAGEVLVVAAAVVYILLSRYIGRRSNADRVSRILLFLDTLVYPGALLFVLYLSGRELTVPYNESFRLFLWSLLVLALAWLINRYLQFFFWRDFFERKYGTRAPKILPNIVAVALYLLALYIVMTVIWGRSMSGLLVSTGVLVGIIGFALQNFISDFFYGFSITLEKPFSKGDWIELGDGTLGKVVDISWRAIHLLSFNESIYIIPNSTISRNTVHNLSRPTRTYALWLKVSVDSAYPPDLVRRMLTEAALSCDSVLRDPMPAINISDASGNPYVYVIYVYFEDFISHYRGKTELYMTVHQRLERAGIAPSSNKYAVSTEETPVRHYSRPSVKDSLQSIALFEPLSEEDIDLIAANSYEQTFHPGDTIMREGAEESSLLIIASGVVQVSRQGQRGKEVDVERLGAGDFIGEMALLTGRPRSATVRALVATSGIIVPHEAIEPILKKNPQLSEKIAEIMVERKMRDPQFSRRVQDSPTPTSRLLRLYMNRIGTRIHDFFKVKPGK